MIVWIVVNHYISISTTIRGVPVRVKNIPKGKTIEGLQTDGRMLQTLNLHISGRRDVLSQLGVDDLEIVIDAKNSLGKWKTLIDYNNVIALNSNIDFSGIRHVEPQEIELITTEMVTEKVPIFICKPNGEPPKGYQFLDIVPYRLSLNLTGPKREIRRIKKNGLKLRFNLDQISRDELDRLYENRSDIENTVEYYVPDSWKKLYVANLSKYPYKIDDRAADRLCINFVKKDLIPLSGPIPISFFFSNQFAKEETLANYSLKTNDLVEKKNGIYIINKPLFIKGVSTLFADIMKNMIQLVITVTPEGRRLRWQVQVMNPQELEDRYVAEELLRFKSPVACDQDDSREEYFRNRFRKYLSQIRLYTANNKKLSLDIEKRDRQIAIHSRTIL